MQVAISSGQDLDPISFVCGWRLGFPVGVPGCPSRVCLRVLKTFFGRLWSTYSIPERRLSKKSHHPGVHPSNPPHGRASEKMLSSNDRGARYVLSQMNRSRPGSVWSGCQPLATRVRAPGCVFFCMTRLTSLFRDLQFLS